MGGRWTYGFLVFVFLIAGFIGLTVPEDSAGALESSSDPMGRVALFNPASGEWNIRYADGAVDQFYYGSPGDAPLLGDWDCDGVDTAAMFRPSNGFIYLRNSNSFGVADEDFFYGIGGDIPLAGDWDNDGCDTFSIYRPSEGKVYVSNRLGTFPADYSFFYGIPGDKPFAGDFDGDGVTTVGLYRDTTGFVYFRDSLSTGVADFAFFYGAPSDRIVAADWDGDGDDTVGIFRSSNHRFYLSNANVQGFADVEFDFGQTGWVPVGGEVGIPINPGDTRDCDSFNYQEHAQAWFGLYFPWWGDVALLDVHGDGVACDMLPHEAQADPRYTYAMDALGRLEVRSEGPAPEPYIRDTYDGTPVDADGDCVATRHELLAIESLDVAQFSNCRVISGRWLDPWSGDSLTEVSNATIDHHIPLANAHRSGAWRFDHATRARLANDLDEPATLNIIAGWTNQSKSDSGPESWRPPQSSTWCAYAVDWIIVKDRWGLNVLETEKAALDEMLGTCVDGGPLRGEVVRQPMAAPPVIVTTSSTTTTTTTVVGSPGGLLQVASCNRYDERVVLVNADTVAVNISGWVLHDEGNKHSITFSSRSLAPGAQLHVLTGQNNVADEPHELLWKNQYVWNNEGDIAFLRLPGGELVSQATC